jgi:hypothetical protein
MKTFTLLLTPQIAVIIAPFTGWQLMIFYVLMMYVCLKCATGLKLKVKAPQELLIYTTCWAGMQPIEFQEVNKHKINLLPGTASLLVGITIFLLANTQTDDNLKAFSLFMSMFFIFHFGLLDLNAQALRCIGKNTKPIMNAPWKAKTLSEFWGKRWNMAFRDAAHQLIFKPIKKRLGATSALFAVFAFSGVVHEAVISAPARGGYGGPMIYFLIQFLGLIVQRKFKKFDNALFTWLILLGPLPWLFHEPFFINVVIPISNL